MRPPLSRLSLAPPRSSLALSRIWALALLSLQHYHAKNTVLRDFDFAVADGAKEWLTLLNEYQVPCCVCAGATMDRGALASVLERAGLRDLCPISVTAEDGCETTEQAYLVGCIKVGRPPERCQIDARFCQIETWAAPDHTTDRLRSPPLFAARASS